MSKAHTAEEFWDHVEKTSTCWIWRGKLNKSGYGQFDAARLDRSFLAHRIAFRLAGNEIPDGLQLDHLCRNRCCVNPAHLEPVTNRINSLRGESIAAKYARRTHCAHGHPLDGFKGGARYCKTCHSARERQRYQALDREQRKIVTEKHWQQRLQREGREGGPRRQAA